MRNKNPKNKYQKSNLQKNNNINDNINDSGFIFNSTIEDEQKVPEWMTTDTKNIQDINKRFHKEILDYVDYITPKNNSLVERQKTFELFTKIIQKYRPDWKVILFGSFSQNISTVFSDLDFLILYKNQNSSQEYELKEMYNLMNFLKKEEFSKNIRLAKARVPVIRATCTDTGINVDISINRENGYQAVEAIQKIINEYKILRPSIIILKILLKKFNLNDPHTGGMNSYLLFHLVYFFFIHKIKDKIKAKYLDSNNKDKKEDNKYINKEELFNSNENISYDGQNDANNSENENNDNKNSEGNDNEDFKNNQNILYNNINYKEYNYEMNIGHFIILFLKFYGYEFDYKKYSISLYGDNFGKLFLKEERKDMECSSTISVEKIVDKG